MNDHLILERLASHGTVGATPDPVFEDRLHGVLTRELSRPMRPKAHLLLAAALLATLALGAAAVAGGLVRVPSPDALLLDPAVLEPCDVLPGPGTGPGEAPRTHVGDPRIGGMACAYGWDGGDNPHFQLRPWYTTAAEAEALAARLMPGSREVLIASAGVRALIGTVEAMDHEYVAVVAHQDPYLFVGYLRTVSEPAEGGEWLRPIDDRDRVRAVGLVSGILGNLTALNAEESPAFAMEITP